MKTWQGSTLLTTTNYSGSFVYEGAAPVLSFFGSPEGRTIKNGANFEYQYAIADHQGNTRVVFSSVTPTTQTVTATYETAAQSTEATQFNNYPSASGINVVGTNNVTPGGTRSQYLNAGYMGMVGVAKSYKVYAGDKVKLEAYARYNAPSSTNSSIASFATVLLNAFGLPAPAGGETGTAAAAVNNWGSIAAGGFGNGSPANGLPKAFINIVLFDANYKLLDFTYAQVTSSGAPTKIEREYTVKEAGYAYLFISNEHSTQCDVYFDDVKMSYTPTNVIQYNEYYPFGLQTANSWTRENSTVNNFLANGGTELNTTSNLYDLEYRNYDPVLGRMNGVDPMATKYASLSPYNFSFNNPVTFTDRNGADPNAGCMACHYGYQDADSRAPGRAPLEVMDGGGGYIWNPATVGGYGVAGMSYTSWQASVFAGVQLTKIGQLRADAQAVREGRMSVAEFAAQYGEAPTEADLKQITSTLGLTSATASGGTLYTTFVMQAAIMSTTGGHVAMQVNGVAVIAMGITKAEVARAWREGRQQHYQQTQGNGPGLMHAGMGTDVSLYLLSVASYAGGVYEDVRAGQIAKQTKGMLNEWQQIRNFNKSYKTGRQATLASNIIKNVNTLDAMKVASRRMIGVGLVLGVADMANNDFSAESVGWFAADTIMTGIGLTGWGAPIAGVYFLGRFAYGIYDMATKDGN
ncbi:MAG: hypothetical protein KF775_14215 [Cyclobacteriaceae bacterium]|nr:hypothetical protein [Cyclobacteriaceae bacterium]